MNRFGSSLVRGQRATSVYRPKTGLSLLRGATSGFTHIPFGETWVLTNGKVLHAGLNFILPSPLAKIRAIKTPHTIVFGVITPEVIVGAKPVNGYAVANIRITDFAKSALYRDPETESFDSERALARLLKKKFVEALQGLSVFGKNEKLNLEQSLLASLKTKEGEYGIEILSVDIRGAFDASLNISAKLQAFDEPVPEPGAAGHNLSPDYWADVLSPPFFERNTFGSEKLMRTPAAVSLEWTIPSPPDYHHFNMLPKMTAATEDQKH